MAFATTHINITCNYSMIPYLPLKKVTASHLEEIEVAIAKVVESGWYLKGEATERFENDYAAYIGTQYCVGCGNGLDALSLIFRAYKELGVMDDGDEVIVPANTFIASILSISENRLRPVLVEPRIDTLEIYQLSVDDLEQALELTNKDDIKDEQSMLQGIIRFGDETAKEVMTTRQDIEDIDIRSSYKEVLQFIIDNNFSRIPVYQDNEDNIRGLLYIKDLLPYLSKPDNFRWQSLIRPPYFVPETKKIDDLLREFQENKIHIAIVVDEFGGTSGLVTLEDILEEIVGEINDEYDEEEKTYTKVNNNTYIFEGKTLLSDVCKILNIDDDEFDDVAGDADSLAGLLLELKGDFLSLHEKIDYKQYSFEVMGLEERRISKVKIVIHDKGDNAVNNDKTIK